MTTLFEPPNLSVVSGPMNKPLRILYIIDSLMGPGGAELSLLRLVLYLRRYDYHCRIVTFHINPAASLFVEQFPCPVEHWQLNNVYDRTAMRVALRLRRLVPEDQIDVVHTFFQTSDLWAGPIAKMIVAKILISSRRDMGILRKRKPHIGYRLLKGV